MQVITTYGCGKEFCGSENVLKRIEVTVLFYRYCERHAFSLDSRSALAVGLGLPLFASRCHADNERNSI